ncbi:MAG: hypothetical protein LQ339_001951 [Xanthoria mediterranea]|nr:MAG: hypothetical protein LQ339_001951 [Xanthoria mediterranea]
MAPRKGSRAPGAPRAGGYHVKTGCITCKIRHVKCDEEKPECYKCKSTGRKCDGYFPQKAVSSQPSLPPKQRNQSIVKVVQSSFTPLPTAIGGWTGTYDELRGFDYFRVQTSEDLAYSLNASLQELVLQNSHHNLAIKHAAIALGSLGETIRFGSHPTSLNTLSPAFMKHEFARSQYCKAIQLLQRDIQRNEKETIEIALISCFLFVVFEFLQGNDQASTSHLRSGLAILRKQYFPHADTMGTVKGSKLNPMQSEIARIFHILDTQATMWLGLGAFQDKSYTPIDCGPASSYISPNHFDSLDDACEDLIKLITRIYNFRRYASKHDFAPSTTHVPTAIYAQKEALLQELHIHRCRLSQFLTRQTDARRPEDPHRITILRINRKVTTMMLAAYLKPHEEIFYAECMSQFWQIISLSSFILRQSPGMPRRVVQIVHKNHDVEDAPPGRNLFSFFAGLIQPLYFTAIKCREKVTAHKAMDLLEGEPWREGAWDSAAMAKIARRKVVELEDAGWYDTEYHGTPVEDTGRSAELSVDWPLATDPFITYPV